MRLKKDKSGDTASYAPLDRIWGHMLFSWLPSWYMYSDLPSYTRFSRAALPSPAG